MWPIISEDSWNIIAIFILIFTIYIVSDFIDWIRVRFLGHDLPHVNISDDIPEHRMQEVAIPFTLKLKEEDTSEDVKCLIASRSNYRILCVWEVAIEPLFYYLRLPWPLIYNSIQEDNFLIHHCRVKDDVISDGVHEEKTVSFPNKIHIQNPSYNRYPLVIIMFIENHNACEPEDVVALINIIHLKGPICFEPSTILYRFIKQAGGRLISLQKLFLPNLRDETVDLEDNMEIPDDSELCVVCQEVPLSRALLPCRHACLCKRCFSQLRTCPLCRAAITSYIRVGSEE